MLAFNTLALEILKSCSKRSQMQQNVVSKNNYRRGILDTAAVLLLLFAQCATKSASAEPVEVAAKPNCEALPCQEEICARLSQSSYVIEENLFTEPHMTRCMSSTVPDDLEKLAPSFILLVAPGKEARMKATSSRADILEAGFDPNKPTMIFLHGWAQSYPSAASWMCKIRRICESNARVSEQNLIMMDWGAAAQAAYQQAAARTSAMGSFLATFLRKLVELGARPESFHLVGHSLGAHVAGFAGKRLLPMKLGRITALDAAGPCFGRLLSNSPTDRLNSQDAHQVVVYHYDDRVAGLKGQHGHLDIYVNGGRRQPGTMNILTAAFHCLVMLFTGKSKPVAVCHTRSTDVPSCQLAQVGCQQVAYECKDWNSFKKGKCGYCDDQNSQCFFMGFAYQYTSLQRQQLDAESIEAKKMYIATGPRAPHCVQHYQVLVRFKESENNFKNNTTNGNKHFLKRILLKLTTENGQELRLKLKHHLDSRTFSGLLLTELPASKFISGKLKVNNLLILSSDFMRKKFEYVQVNFMSNIDPKVRRSMSSRLCATSSLANELDLISEQRKNWTKQDWLNLSECPTS